MGADDRFHLKQACPHAVAVIHIDRALDILWMQPLEARVDRQAGHKGSPRKPGQHLAE